MNVQALRELLEKVQQGDVSTDDAMARLRGLPFSDLGYARVDHHRQLRQGLPEVVFGQSKTASEITGIVSSLAGSGQNALVTRIDPERARVVLEQHPGAVFHERARCLSLVSQLPESRLPGPVAVITAGTSDLAVADEAALTLEMAGERVERLTDVGVAGIHRLLSEMPRLADVCAVICIAGMEGALPSVLGGLVAVPVVAVPTSVGYGAAAAGFTALFGMLTSCAAGVTVVNIDNGFGGAMAVLRLAALPDLAKKPAQESSA